MFPTDTGDTQKGVIFSDSTWRIHAERGRLRRVLCHHGKALNKLNIHTAMQLWQGKDSLHGCYLRQLVYAIKMSAIFVIHQQVNKELHRFISHDRSVYLKSFAAQLNHVDKSRHHEKVETATHGQKGEGPVKEAFANGLLGERHDGANSGGGKGKMETPLRGYGGRLRGHPLRAVA